MTARNVTPPLLRRSAGRGFTLVELMIALTLGLLIVAGVTSLFIGMRASYSFQDGLSRVQENGRFAVQTLTRELRMAGYRLCPQASNIKNWLDTTSGSYLSGVYGGQPVLGWEANGTSAGDSYTVGTGTNWVTTFPEGLPPQINDPLAGSDIVVLKRESPLNLAITSTSNSNINFGNSTNIRQGKVVAAFQQDCSAGDIWMKSNNANGTSLPLQNANGFGPGNDMGVACTFGTNSGNSNRFCSNLDTNSYIVLSEASGYYVRENPAGEPSLYAVPLDDNTATSAQELVQGVENMQALYGEDTDGDRTADSYVAADAVNNWGNVVSVRMALLLRNDSFVQTESDLRTYDVAYTTVTPVEDGRVRQVMTLTVALRNRLP